MKIHRLNEHMHSTAGFACSSASVFQREIWVLQALDSSGIWRHPRRVSSWMCLPSGLCPYVLWGHHYTPVCTWHLHVYVGSFWISPDTVYAWNRAAYITKKDLLWASVFSVFYRTECVEKNLFAFVLTAHLCLAGDRNCLNGIMCICCQAHILGCFLHNQI